MNLQSDKIEIIHYTALRLTKAMFGYIGTLKKYFLQLSLRKHIVSMIKYYPQKQVSTFRNFHVTQSEGRPSARTTEKH